MWLGLGLMPLAYDFFGVLPTPHLLDEPMPDAAIFTLGYAVLSLLIFQAAVRPMVQVDRATGTLTVVGPVFTTEVPLEAIGAIRIQPGPLIVAAEGKDIPAYCLMSPNIPVPRFWTRYHRRLKGYVSDIADYRETSSSAPNASVHRKITGPHPAQLSLLALDVAYLAHGLWASHS